MKQKKLNNEEFSCGFNLIRSLELRKDESVFLLTDEKVDSQTVAALVDLFTSCSKKVQVGYLPRELEHDFPEAVADQIIDFDVIFMCASQSWYQAPSRRVAKYGYKKRVIEYYAPKLSQLSKGALCADYKRVAYVTSEIHKHFRKGNAIKVKAKAGSDFTFTVKDVFMETGLFNEPGSGGNMPAGEISLGIEDRTFCGQIVFDVSFDCLGKLDTSALTIIVENGYVAEVKGKFKSQFQILLSEENSLNNVAEVGIGTNSYALIGQSVLEDEKKLGTMHIGFGNNTYFGGTVKGRHLDGVFLEPQIYVNDNLINIYVHDSVSGIIKKGRNT
jgi:hypothetical protein